MIDLSYPNLLNLFPEHRDPRRTESASFLVWYLEHYYRLDPLEAVDSVCDQSGDKGIDGIYVNESANTIDVFQAKIYQAADRTLGDAPLREFRGTLSQFATSESLQNLVDSAGDAEVAQLIKRLDLIKRLPTYEVRGVFLTNIDTDNNGEAFLRGEPLIQTIGRSILQSTYVSDEREITAGPVVTFDISGLPISKYIVDARSRALIAPLKARELVNLQGIADQSVFAFNVRGPLGRTQVNRDIVASIRNPRTHKLFPLFHNGITIICERVRDDAEKISIENYHVVNGCQSLSALYDNRSVLTDDLRILTRILEIDVGSELSEMVTRYSNNQNGVRARDFKSNSPIQIRLQNEFRENYHGQYAFEIKRGEHPGDGQLISNEDAGLYLMAFDMKEPWATHRKYQVFDDKHADLFARPEVTADRIVLCHLLAQAALNASTKIENTLLGKYVLTKFVLIYMIRLVLEEDQTGRQILQRPSDFVRSLRLRDKLSECIGRVVNDMIVDINHEVKDVGADFDYRGRLRDADWVRALAKNVISSYQKLVQRNRIPSLHSEWTSAR